MASKIKVTPQKKEMLEKQGRETPLLDLSDAAVKKLIRTAKKRGYVTLDQISALLASEEVNSEEIENILAKFNEMGINLVETTEAGLQQDQAAREEPEDETEEETEGENASLEIQRHKVPAKSTAKEPAERTDDPVRIYLREMASVDLLSREGEIAVAKRIEAGREAMIAGLCESPLTFQAISIWRDEVNGGKVLLARYHRPRCNLCRPKC
jgi:RNA polymerase primary sigma factor